MVAQTAPFGFSSRLSAPGNALTSRAVTAEQRYCVRHRHGDRWHSCSDTRHPVYDVAHSHTSLPVIYRPPNRRVTARRPADNRGTRAARGTSTGFDSGRGYLYFGIKSGSMTLDDAAADSGLPKGVVLGYAWGTVWNRAWSEHAIEFEHLSTSQSEASEITAAEQATRFNSQYTASSLYGVRRIGEVYYTKMKVGLTRQSRESEGLEQTSTEFSGGLGLGWRAGNIVLEGEYTLIGSSAKFLSIGASIVF